MWKELGLHRMIIFITSQYSFLLIDVLFGHRNFIYKKKMWSQILRAKGDISKLLEKKNRIKTLSP